ncbi:MAG: hypothetical protein KKA65_03480 [Nanoarchaeota archaeon]|nr:hypothetical protein [Nanoarchaeota archaeon]MCG2719266.1 hypothetical protein [Nanoarchaeota archaeon]
MKKENLEQKTEEDSNLSKLEGDLFEKRLMAGANLGASGYLIYKAQYFFERESSLFGTATTAIALLFLGYATYNFIKERFLNNIKKY